MFSSSSSNKDSNSRISYMPLKCFKNYSSTPSYAQPTISFTKHQNFDLKSEKYSPTKSLRLCKNTSKFDNRAFNTVSAVKNCSPITTKITRKSDLLTRMFEIYQDQSKDISKQGSSFEKILLYDYDKYYTLDGNKENCSPKIKKDLTFNDPVLKKTLKNNSNISSKSSKALRTRYEKLDSSSYLSSDSSDSLMSKFQQDISAVSSPGLPKDYLKSLTKDSKYISANEWDSLIDIVEYYCQSLFETNKEEIQDLKNYNEELETQNENLKNLINDLQKRLAIDSTIIDSENKDESETHIAVNNTSLRRVNSHSSNTDSAISKNANSNTVLNVISTNPNGIKKVSSHQKFNLEDGSDLRLEEELRD